MKIKFYFNKHLKESFTVFRLLDFYIGRKYELLKGQKHIYSLKKVQFFLNINNVYLAFQNEANNQGNTV